MLKRIATMSALAVLALSVSSSATISVAQAATVAPRDITVTPSNIMSPLVPMRKTRGDREFGGGPMVNCNVYLYVTPDRRQIRAKIHFKAQETKGDRSTVDEVFYRPVYNAPRGKTIDRILDAPSSAVSFRSKSGGFQFLGPGEDFRQFINTLVGLAKQVLAAERTLSDRRSDTREIRQARGLLDRLESASGEIPLEGNHVHVVHPKSGPVSLMAIVGDTGGDDISDDRNGKDDTRIQSIVFKPLRVRLR